MAEPAATTATTGVPGGHEPAGFPPFKLETFPSQLFWLVITFGILFVVLWRVAGPRINAAITSRRGAINGAIAEASKARADEEAAHGQYQAALTAARTNHFRSCKFHCDFLFDVSDDRGGEGLR